MVPRLTLCWRWSPALQAGIPQPTGLGSAGTTSDEVAAGAAAGEGIVSGSANAGIDGAVVGAVDDTASAAVGSVLGAAK
jgi:hypothetical protein